MSHFTLLILFILMNKWCWINDIVLLWPIAQERHFDDAKKIVLVKILEESVHSCLDLHTWNIVAAEVFDTGLLTPYVV